MLIATTERGPQRLEYDHLLVCTGAAPWEPPFAQVDHQRVLNTRDVLGLHDLPEQLLVVGAGATGCEFAEFFQSCGSRVTLLSSRPQILPSEDRDIADVVHEAFLGRGMAIELNARASNVERDGELVHVHGRGRPPLPRHATRSSAWACAPTPTSSASSPSGVEVGPRGEISIERLLPHGERAHLGRRRRHGRLDAGLHGGDAGPHLGALGARPPGRPDGRGRDRGHRLHAARGRGRRAHREQGRGAGRARRRHAPAAAREPARPHRRASPTA